ncbi:hypothetical protein DPMN_010599 [Dreissena polymorpha]|uniref:Uncharacterized protein n=1 Tax=Dreissena polymorpha TaxID=45954 RepID=A0A9D4S164_DREPO|nr:hypothetical protein DPMN_010599 [Dreissena polymorpha]
MIYRPIAILKPKSHYCRKAGSVPAEHPVNCYSTGTHRGFTSIRPRQSYGNTPVYPWSSPVMPRRGRGECWWRPSRAPVYRCTVAIPCRHSRGHHRRQPGRCRSSARVCMDPGVATVPSRLFLSLRQWLP